MNIEKEFCQLLVALEEQQEIVSESVLNIRTELAHGGDNQVILAKTKKLADRVELNMNYDRAIAIISALRGAFVEIVGVTREQDALLREIGFKPVSLL